MDSLEKGILKYKKKDFKVQQKRTLKDGSRTFLVKRGNISEAIEEALELWIINCKPA